jgi:hypothetical protein
MQRDWGSSRVSVIQRTPCESTGKPVQPTYCSLPAELTTMGSSGVPVDFQHSPIYSALCDDAPDWLRRTEAAGVQGPHVEEVNALHLSKKFKTLETCGLFGIGGNGSGLRTRGQKVLSSLDLCTHSAMVPRNCHRA